MAYFWEDSTFQPMNDLRSAILLDWERNDSTPDPIVFGNILTKLCNQLSTVNLEFLTELKLHVHDDHVHRTTKTCLQHHFGCQANLIIPQATASKSHPAPSPLIGSSDDAPEPANNFSPLSPEPTELQAIAASFIQQLDNDNDLSPGNWSTSQLHIPLGSLFDFQKENWIKIHEHSAHRSLNEELELYEMLDMDAEGEDDDGLDNLGLDKTAEDILSI
ncbi:hypothetical protein B0H10DRAFT_1951326 [Mycena sp. CBHHK59/15]|nr:hypothetical protein B0H10DRAFT_1951326 [Mycena sp. CBHHK59/15]